MNLKKKKILLLIPIMIIVLIVIGIIYFFQKTTTIIYLDINPSLKLELNRNQKVKKIEAINRDGEEVISKEMKGKSLNQTLELLTSNLIQNGYLEDKQTVILVYSEGNIKKEKLEKIVKESFNKEYVFAECIFIETITKEDKKLAKEHKISPSKAAYINQIIKEHKDVPIDEILSKSIENLLETSRTGDYCETGYEHREGRCFREMERIDASPGLVCPSHYYEYNGVCYHEEPIQDGKNLVCNDGFQLINNKCEMKIYNDIEGVCPENGFYNPGSKKCEIDVYTGDAVEYCDKTPDQDLLYNGRCLARKPTINGGCLNNDVIIDGSCFDTSPTSGYPAVWVCPDGSWISNPDGSLQHEDKKCYDRQEVEPESFKCNNKDEKIENDKCVMTMKQDPQKKHVCPKNYTMIDDMRCLNLSKTIEKENGYVCNKENERLIGKTCIVYEIIDPIHPSEE